MITNLRMDLRFKLYSPATTSPALNDTQAPTVTDFLLRLLCLPFPDWGLGWRHGDQGDQVHSTHNTIHTSHYHYNYSAACHSGGQLQV